MPELPDVEQFKKLAQKTSLNKQIISVQVTNDKVLEGTDQKKLNSKLNNKMFRSVYRHGKHLLLDTEENVCMSMHFGMSGSLRYSSKEEKTGNYDRVIVIFANREKLVYTSKRLLGRVGMCRNPTQFITDNKLGPDALSIGKDEFAKMMQHKRGNVKQALMDQTKIAGIGNHYSDEILYQAEIFPLTPVSELSAAQIDLLYLKMNQILRTANKLGADVAKFPQDWFLKFRKQGEKCSKCKSRVEKGKISGRSFYYCPGCQK